GDGVGSFGQPVSSTLSLQLFAADFGDFNGDGKQDFVAATAFSTSQGSYYRFSIFYSDGAGHFGAPATFDQFQVSAVIGQLRLLSRDLNNDARPDALVVGDGKIFGLTTDGTGKLSAVKELASNYEGVNTLAIGNFDADGKADFVSIDKQRNGLV